MRKTTDLVGFFRMMRTGRMYLIRAVHGKVLVLSRMKRWKDSLRVSEHQYRKWVGTPELGVKPQVGDFLYRYGITAKLKLVKKLSP